jgi:hypothetical protein
VSPCGNGLLNVVTGTPAGLLSTIDVRDENPMLP